jgi:hypothetical protein
MTNLAEGRPLKSWTRSETTKVRAWAISGNLARVSGDRPPEATDARADVVDVRPFVEVDKQLGALHGRA